MGLSFGKYIQKIREQQGLQQDQVGDFGQPYISDIENGRVRPARKGTINKLARALKLREDQTTWLWVYSLLNEDPYKFFARYGLHNGKRPSNPAHVVSEAPTDYTTSDEYEIPLGASPQEIRARLGRPDEALRFGHTRKWIYRHKAIHIIFEHDQVVDVIFK